MPVATRVSLQLSKKGLSKAIGLAKAILIPRGNPIFENALVRVSGTSFRITATNESISIDVAVPLESTLIELDDDPLTFLVGIQGLFDLSKEEPGDFINLVVDDQKHSITYKVQESELLLPIRDAGEWPNIDSRFDISRESSISVKPDTLSQLLSYTRQFLPSSSDTNMFLVEVRKGLAVSSDRKRFGFYLNSELNDIKLRIPGEQVVTVEKALEFFPTEIHIHTSEDECVLWSSGSHLDVTLSFTQTRLTLPQSLDRVPMTEEPDQIEIQTGTLSKSLARLAIVCSKSDPKVRLDFGFDTLRLTTKSDVGHESFDTLPCSRSRGDQRASLTLDIVLLRRVIKLVTTESCNLNLGVKGSYLKISSELDAFETHSILQAS